MKAKESPNGLPKVASELWVSPINDRVDIAKYLAALWKYTCATCAYICLSFPKKQIINLLYQFKKSTCGKMAFYPCAYSQSVIRAMLHEIKQAFGIRNK